MHEVSLCQSLFAIIEEEAARLNCQKITRVILEVGQLAGIEKSALYFAFTAVTIHTIAQDAVLEIIEVKATALCEHCGKTVSLEQYYDGCSLCHGFSLNILQGEELRIQSIEVI